MSERQELKVSDILTHLENGKTREEIREMYGMTHKELKHVFSHPSLKGKKTKKPFEPRFSVVDDTREEESSHNDDHQDDQRSY